MEKNKYQSLPDDSSNIPVTSNTSNNIFSKLPSLLPKRSVASKSLSTIHYTCQGRVLPSFGRTLPNGGRKSKRKRNIKNNKSIKKNKKNSKRHVKH